MSASLSLPRLTASASQVNDINWRARIHKEQNAAEHAAIREQAALATSRPRTPFNERLGRYLHDKTLRRALLAAKQRVKVLSRNDERPRTSQSMRPVSRGQQRDILLRTAAPMMNERELHELDQFLAKPRTPMSQRPASRC